MGGLLPHAATRSTMYHFAWSLLMATLCLTSPSTASSCRSSCLCFLMNIYQYVNCSNRELSEVPRELPSRNTTTYLDLSNNNITTLHRDSLSGFDTLIFLSLSNNKLKEIHRETFYNLHHLLTVQLSHNTIQKVDADTFERSEIGLIDLSYNQLILPSSDHFLISGTLRVLKISSNYIRNLPDKSLSRLPNLEQLDIANTMLKSVSIKSLRVLQNLQKLALSENPLVCDCDLKETRKWIQDKGVKTEVEILCVEPPSMEGRPWVNMDDMQCQGDVHPFVITYTLCVIAAVLVVIAVLVGILVWQRRRRKKIKSKRGIPLPPVPVGEYIEVLPTRSKDHDYERVGNKEEMKEKEKREREDKEKKEKEAPRYVTEAPRCVTNCTYLSPYMGETGPIYVNMKGPPLPLRRPSSDIGTMGPIIPPPGSPSLRPASPRRCSVPLLEGCDFYEVVD